MNPKLQKTVRDIERTKEKIAELQTLLPELERQRTDLENTEIIKAVRSACVAPGDIEEFLDTYRQELKRQPPPVTNLSSVVTGGSAGTSQARAEDGDGTADDFNETEEEPDDTN